MTSNTLKIALVQSDIYWESVDANLSELEEKLWGLDGAADVIILPETFNTGFSPKESLAEVPNLKTQKWLRQMAVLHQVLIGGSYLVKDGGILRNRFLFAFPDGSFAHYDKKHLFSLSDEGDKLQAGDKRLVLEYKGWKINPLICYDLRFPEWSRNRFVQEEYLYDILIYSANWPASRTLAWDTLLQARAIENQSYVIGVNRVGADGNGLNHVGHSQAVSYFGDHLLEPFQDSAIKVVELNKKDLIEYRASFPFLKDMK